MSKKHKVCQSDDMLTVFLITFALSAFQYEKHISESFMKIYNIIVFAAFAAMWLWFLARSGADFKIAFPVFTVIFWAAPHLVIFLANDGPEFLRLSIVMYVLSEFLGFLINTPIDIIGGILGIARMPAYIATLLLFGAAYTAGMFFGAGKTQPDKGNYT